MLTNTQITAAQVRETLDYDVSTGIFRWKSARPGVTVGAIAGSIQRDGYRRIRLFYRKYPASRLAFLYVTGRWPKFDMDHKNLIRDDNRFDNLREATKSQNNANRGHAKTKKVGIKGIYFKGNKWEASITKDRIYTYLGTFRTAEEASRAYQAASKKLHGEFSRC